MQLLVVYSKDEVAKPSLRPSYTWGSWLGQRLMIWRERDPGEESREDGKKEKKRRTETHVSLGRGIADYRGLSNLAVTAILVSDLVFSPQRPQPPRIICAPCMDRPGPRISPFMNRWLARHSSHTLVLPSSLPRANTT